MFSIKAITRISLSLGLIAACVVWSAIGLNLIPNPFDQKITSRVELCETIAIASQHFAENGQISDLQQLLSEIASRNPSIQSVGLRDTDGMLKIAIGGHAQSWQVLETNTSTEDQMLVKIFHGGESWGQLEIQFHKLNPGGLLGFLQFPFPLLLFCSCSIILVNWAFLGRILKKLNPSKVVPDRVRMALNSLAEGLLLTDRNERIVLANDAFTKIIGSSSETLQGFSPSDFAWESENENCTFPWTQTLFDNNCVRGSVLALRTNVDEYRKFIVNSTPIHDERGDCRGVLSSFDDVTPMERKKEELANMLNVLKKSRDEVRRQNEELQILASRDPLTGCFNRRSFFEKFNQLWESDNEKTLSAMMVDIDHFKNINDNYGHSTGDEVLRHVGHLLCTTIEAHAPDGLVCRYGGEEFAILLPGMGAKESAAIAESLRQAIAKDPVSGVTITASLGVSSRIFGAMDLQHLLDQADQCLYVAKRNGRNQVVRWDMCQDQLNNDEPLSGNDTKERAPTVMFDDAEPKPHAIQYPAVTALLSALAFRDRHTALHCSRVSQLCIAIASDLMTADELYSLEIAALLHDIGKIGVPDAILYKPGKLDENEWLVMNRFHDIGVEIARSAFTDDEIAEIIANYHSVYRNDSKADTTKSNRVLLASKILVLCDSFDAMISDKVYAKGMPQSEAIEEIKRQVPDKFDEALVERLVNFVERYPDWSLQDQLEHISKRTAVAIGGHLAQFSEAIAESDVNAIRKIVKELQQTARKAEVNPVIDATGRLHEALHANEMELTQVMELTAEVMELCRSTRSVIMKTDDRS
jgi:diguanylate cyclase (GGDEF)-like protein/PAS domain S-box-containing protein/putative nucleotidyltransferase with HDIG domain